MSNEELEPTNTRSAALTICPTCQIKMTADEFETHFEQHVAQTVARIEKSRQEWRDKMW